MTFKVKGSIQSVNSILDQGVIFDNEKIPSSLDIPMGKTSVERIDDSTDSDLAKNTLVSNFGAIDNSAGQLSFNTGDWENSNSAPVKLMMRVLNNGNDSDWVTVFDSSKTTVSWSSIAYAGQTVITVPNLDYARAIVFINGVFQMPGISYNTFGGTISFSSPLSIGDELYIEVGTNLDDSTITEYNATATSNQTVFTLPSAFTNIVVFVNGVLQYPSKYSLSGSTLTMSDGLSLSDDLYVFGGLPANQTYSSTVATETNTFSLTSGTLDSPYVFVNGILQYEDSYSISGNTITFVSNLFADDDLFVIYKTPIFIDKVTTSYTSTITSDFETVNINVPYFNFTELQLFINGILQNPDSGAYTQNGTELTLSSELQALDDIHVIVYNTPVPRSEYVTKSELSSYTTRSDFNELVDALDREGIDFGWDAHMPTLEVAYGLPKGSLKKWIAGYTSLQGNYWLYSDGTIWAGVGTLGAVPAAPFYQLDSNKNTITWSYLATDDNTNIINVPYKFSTINIFINGVLQSVDLGHYTYTGQTITLNGSLSKGDNLIAVLGNLVFATSPYITVEELSKYALKSDINNSYTVLSGNSTNRPTNTYVGFMYFDTTLNKPIWRNSNNNGWVDSLGSTI